MGKPEDDNVRLCMHTLPFTPPSSGRFIINQEELDINDAEMKTIRSMLEEAVTAWVLPGRKMAV
jgi:hypothetical protein